MYRPPSLHVKWVDHNIVVTRNYDSSQFHPHWKTQWDDAHISHHHNCNCTRKAITWLQSLPDGQRCQLESVWFVTVNHFPERGSIFIQDNWTWHRTTLCLLCPPRSTVRMTVKRAAQNSTGRAQMMILCVDTSRTRFVESEPQRRSNCCFYEQYNTDDGENDSFKWWWWLEPIYSWVSIPTAIGQPIQLIGVNFFKSGMIYLYNLISIPVGFVPPPTFLWSF